MSPILRQVTNDPEFLRNVERLANTKHKYFPVFSGKTEEGGKVVLYIHIDDNSMHIQRPDGEFCSLSPHAMFEEYWDLDRYVYHIRVISPEWYGEAKGSRIEILEEPMR